MESALGFFSHSGSYSGSGSCSCSYSRSYSGFRIPAFPDAPFFIPRHREGWKTSCDFYPVSPTPPHPEPKALYSRVSVSVLVKTCVAAITQLKVSCENLDEFSPWKRRKRAKKRETNVWHYHGQYFAGKKVFKEQERQLSRSSCSRFTYSLFVQCVKVSSIPFLPSRACLEKTEKC